MRFAVDRRTAERRAGRARRSDRAVDDRPSTPVRAQPAHPQRSAGRPDRGVDGGVRLDQPGPGRRAGRHPRRSRSAAGGPQARARRGAGDPVRASQRGAEAGVPDRGQPAGPAGRMERGVAGRRSWRGSGTRASTSTWSASTPRSWSACWRSPMARRRARRRTRSPSRPRSRSASRATYGSWAITGSSAATPRCSDRRRAGAGRPARGHDLLRSSLQCGLRATRRRTSSAASTGRF